MTVLSEMVGMEDGLGEICTKHILVQVYPGVNVLNDGW